MALTCAVAIVALRATASRLQHVALDLATDVITLEQVRLRAEQGVSALRGYLLGGELESLQRFERAFARVGASLDSVRDPDSDDELDIRVIEDAVNRYEAAARDAVALRRDSGDPRAVLELFEQTLGPARHDLDRELTEFTHLERSRFETASRQARVFSDRASTLVSVATGLGMLLAVALAWVSMRRLSADYTRERAATTRARDAIAARDEIVAIVAHDLRAPLTTITVGAELVDRAVDVEPAQKQLGMMKRASKHMARLIDEMLDIATLDRGTFELQRTETSLGALFEAVRALYATPAEDASIDLAIEPAPEGSMFADKDRLLQVLSNLVGNAIKFTPPNGQVHLSARRMDDHVRIEVADTGPGVPEADVPHLFERFWQGRPRGRGSLGLGLYICKRIIDAHGGAIGVESVPGRGATFWISLPNVSTPSVT